MTDATAHPPSPAPAATDTGRTAVLQVGAVLLLVTTVVAAVLMRGGVGNSSRGCCPVATICGADLCGSTSG